MAIGLLTAGASATDENGSFGQDVADTVNGLITGATPVDAITLAGLPQTAGAPDGFGDVADTVNALTKIAGLSDTVKTVDPVDFYPISMLDKMGDLIFGISTATNQVVQVDTTTHIQTNYGSPLPISGIRNIKAISASTMLVEADGGTGIFKLYRTIDSGGSWGLVYTAPFTDLRMLTNRSICIAEISGQTVLLFGEYNFNGSRVNGSTNDAVRLLRSDDLGSTWSEVTRWNTDGSNNNIRHIHAVLQGPNGRIYVNTGDTDSQSAIYSWDGVAAWPVNVTPINTVQTSWLHAVFGRQAFRAIDLAFKDGFIFFVPDAETGSQTTAGESGVWKINYDLALSSLSKVSAAGTEIKNNAGWLSAVLPSGELLWLMGNANPQVGQKYNGIVVSNQSWTDFKVVGAFRSLDSSTYIVPYDLCVIGDRAYVACMTPSGKTENATAVFKLSSNDFNGAFDDYYRPDTIHPVYWLSESGSDAADGFSPRTPWRQLTYAMTGSRLTYGARLQLVGNFTNSVSQVLPVMSANSRPGDPAEPLVIAGNGGTKTNLTFGSAASDFTFFLMYGAASQKIELQDLRLLTNKATTSYVISNAASGGAGAHSFGFVRCIVGDYSNNITKATRLTQSNSMPIYGYSTVFEASTNVGNAMLGSIAAGNSNYKLVDCFVLLGNIQMQIQGSSNSVVLRRVKFVGAFVESIKILAGTSATAFDGIDCEWWSDNVTASRAITDLATLTWSGQFKRSGGNQVRGVAAAFDGYSIFNQGPIPLINYADYVY